HVLSQKKILVVPLASHHSDRVHIEQQGGGAATLVCFRIEDVSLTKREVKTLKSLGVFAKQVSQIGCRLMRRLDREQHDKEHPDSNLAHRTLASPSRPTCHLAL